MKPHHLGVGGLAIPERTPRHDWSFVGPCSPATRNPRDRKQGHKHLSAWTPKVSELPNDSVAKQQGSRAAGCWLSQKIAYGPLTTFVNEHGETIEYHPRLVTNILHVFTYGKEITFSRFMRCASARDSRDGKSKPLALVRSELIRMLGVNAGIAAYETLTNG